MPLDCLVRLQIYGEKSGKKGDPFFRISVIFVWNYKTLPLALIIGAGPKVGAIKTTLKQQPHAERAKN